MLPEEGKAQEPLCSLTAGSVTPAEGWHEQDVQHPLKHLFLCKIESKNAALPQPDLPWPPSTHSWATMESCAAVALPG